VEQRRAVGLGSLQPCGSEGWRVRVFVRKEDATTCGGEELGYWEQSGAPVLHPLGAILTVGSRINGQKELGRQ
jgi:hypothetical protein